MQASKTSVVPPGPPPGRFHGNHAIVIGASISGLLAARVLSAHFDRVTVLDRDALPSGIANRGAVPQGHHGHGLLASGLRGLMTLFPGSSATWSTPAPSPATSSAASAGSSTATTRRSFKAGSTACCSVARCSRARFAAA